MIDHLLHREQIHGSSDDSVIVWDLLGRNGVMKRPALSVGGRELEEAEYIDTTAFDQWHYPNFPNTGNIKITQCVSMAVSGLAVSVWQYQSGSIRSCSISLGVSD